MSPKSTLREEVEDSWRHTDIGVVLAALSCITSFFAFLAIHTVSARRAMSVISNALIG